MLRVALKGLLGHKLRFALTTLSVVLGVAFVAGTFVLTDSMDRAFTNLFGSIFEDVDVTIRGVDPATAIAIPGAGPRLPESLVDEIRALDEVARAEPSIDGFAQFIARDGEPIGGQGPPTFGLSWDETGVLTMRDGRPPTGPGEVTMDVSTAEAAGFSVGDPVDILLPDGVQTFEIVGLTGFGAEDSLLGATIATFDLREAQAIWGLQGQVHEIAVYAAEGVSAEELRDLLDTRYGSDTIAITTGAGRAAEEAADVRELLSFFNITLLVFGGVALFVGSFIIANTFSIVVAQRTREFALLRAVGASARQVRAAVRIEALAIGLLASTLGIGAGIGLFLGLRTILSAFGMDLPQSGTIVTGRTVAVSYGIGVVVTLLAALGPARRAARVAPVEAMRGSGEVAETWSRRRTVAGAITVVLGIVALLVGLVGGAGIAAVGVGAGLTLLGVALLAPLVADPAARALGALPGRLGVAGVLAQRNARRSPARTAATASALMIGLALVSFVTILAASINRSATAAINEQFAADFVLSPAGFFGGGGSMGLQPGLSTELAARPELAAVSPVRFTPALVAGTPDTVSGVDPQAIAELVALGVTDGTITDLVGDTIFVQTGLLEERDLAIGDTITVTFLGGAVTDLTIVGAYEHEMLLGGSLVSLETLEAHATAGFDLTVYATAADDPIAALAAVEEVAAGFPGVTIRDQAEFRQSTEDQINQVLALMIVLLMLAILIALLGITNTLALAVFERTREIGLLRAVGMARRQTRRMVVWESVIIAAFGALLGLLVGTFFGWAVVRALAEEGLDRLSLPVGQLGLYVVIAGLAGAAAALFPAWRAARLDVLAAVTTE